ncbi:MAG: TetR/AcrR family transcriptional regulator [Gemmatimonadaceae bacterium]
MLTDAHRRIETEEPQAGGARKTAEHPRRIAADRILRAAVRRVVISGVADLTMQQVADEADVSKGLIHYHFHDKETLLARAVEWMTGGIAAREGAALAVSTAATAFDDLWSWLDEELERGEIRVLIELGGSQEPLVSAAVRAAIAVRRDSSSVTVERLFGLLGLKLRIPALMLADVVVAFTDGLAVSVMLDRKRNPREAFNVFWLSLLSLVE